MPLPQSKPTHSKDISNAVRLIFQNYIEPLQAEDLTEAFKEDTSFKAHYRKHIFPFIQDLEERRIQALRTVRKRSFASLGLLILYLLITINFLPMPETSKEWELRTFFFAIACLLLGTWALFPARKHRSSIKAEIFPKIFEFFGPEFKYQEASPFEIESLEASNILPPFNHEETEDYIVGRYDGVKLEIVESDLSKRYRNGERRIFRGLFIQLEMNKNFSGQTLFGAGVSKPKGYDEVKLEESPFTNTFTVYSTDQMEARYLLTQTLMERVMELASLFPDKKLKGSFYNNRLLLMIPTKDNLFEPSSILYPNTFLEDTQKIQQEMGVIFQIIDTLKLSEKTRL